MRKEREINGVRKRRVKERDEREREGVKESGDRGG